MPNRKTADTEKVSVNSKAQSPRLHNVLNLGDNRVKPDYKKRGNQVCTYQIF